MRSCLIPIVLGLVLVLATCKPAPQQTAPPEVPTQAQIEAAVGQVHEAYVAARNAGNAASVAALYTDDAVVMPPNLPEVKGKEAIQLFYQAYIDKFSYEIVAPQVEAAASGNWAFGRGTYAVKVTPKAGGKATDDSGRYLLILTRQTEGPWKIARHIWSSDRPLPSTTKK